MLNLKKIISIEKRCLCFVSNYYDNDYKTLLVTNTFDGIQYVLFKNLMQEVYKCVNNINPDYSHRSPVTILFLSCLSVCLFVCLFVCLCVCLSAHFLRNDPRYSISIKHFHNHFHSTRCLLFLTLIG